MKLGLEEDLIIGCWPRRLTETKIGILSTLPVICHVEIICVISGKSQVRTIARQLIMLMLNYIVCAWSACVDSI